MRVAGLSVVVVALALAGGGCGEDSSSEAEIEAVATTTQMADFVRQVGGDRVAVRQILQANSDPHGYEPRPSDAASVADADVVFRSGGDLDDWLDDLIDDAGGGATVLDLSEVVGAGEDPHWWHNVHEALHAVAGIEATLTKADPDGKAVYRDNARAYVRRLGRLDRGVVACIDKIPPARRRLVTTHDALGSYADRYGLKVVGALIPSLSTSAQPSAGDVERLVDQIEEQQVKAIFPESSLNPKLEQAVARETGARVGRPLWADTLGPAGSDGETYAESIQSNTAAIVEGLSGGDVRCRPPA